jgi:hypothetical protein
MKSFGNLLAVIGLFLIIAHLHVAGLLCFLVGGLLVFTPEKGT